MPKPEQYYFMLSFSFKCLPRLGLHQAGRLAVQKKKRGIFSFSLISLLHTPCLSPIFLGQLKRVGSEMVLYDWKGFTGDLWVQYSNMSLHWVFL